MSEEQLLSLMLAILRSGRHASINIEDDVHEVMLMHDSILEIFAAEDDDGVEDEERWA